jgi:hypothetical protein
LKRYFCTYLNRNFLPRGLASLRPIGLDEFLSDDPALSHVQTDRSRIEFYFT